LLKRYDAAFSAATNDLSWRAKAIPRRFYAVSGAAAMHGQHDV